MRGFGLTLMGGLVVQTAAASAAEAFFPCHSVRVSSGTSVSYALQRTYNVTSGTVDEDVNDAAAWVIDYRAENIVKLGSRGSIMSAGFSTNLTSGDDPNIRFCLTAWIGGQVFTFSSTLQKNSRSAIGVLWNSGTGLLEFNKIEVHVRENSWAVKPPPLNDAAGIVSSTGLIGNLSGSVNTVTLAGFVRTTADYDFCYSSTRHTRQDWKNFVVPMKSRTGASVYEVNTQTTEGI